MSASSPDSLFDEDSQDERVPHTTATQMSPFRPASRLTPPIPGLTLHHDALDLELCERVLQSVAHCGYFGQQGCDDEDVHHFDNGAGSRGDVAQDASIRPNQVMLFGRASEVAGTDLSKSGASFSGLPTWADDLIQQLSEVLRARLDEQTHRSLFPSPGTLQTSIPWHLDHTAVSYSNGKQAQYQDQLHGDGNVLKSPCRSRQLILNLYHPGEGISSHVDLLTRFGDGIILCSFGGGTVMDFQPVEAEHDTQTHGSNTASVSEQSGERFSLYLPARSVLVLNGPARYDWKHGIPARSEDWVLDDAEGHHRPHILSERLDTTTTAKLQDAADLSRRGPRARLLGRSLRLSITIRWLLPGADIVGGL